MHGLFILGVVVLTSAAAAVFAVRGLAWSVGALAAAVAATLEFVGAGLVFFVLNLVVGVATILLVRTLAGGSVSVYVVNDVALLALSLLQGLAFQCWRQAARAKDGTRR
jgi:hypothetical protein